MNHPKRFFSLLSIMLIAIASASALNAQTDAKLQPEPNYEAMLQVIIGQSDAAVKNDIPQNLTAISRQLRENFSFPSYRLANTFIGRISNTGSLEYKSVSDVFGQPSEQQDAPIFLEWSLGRLQTAPDARGQNVVVAQPFRFGARVPVNVAGPKGADGRSSVVLNYEAVGLNMNRVSLPENKPTLIGTLSLPKTTGTMFLVLTVKPTEN